MFCTNCGKEQDGNSAYCTNCGARLGQDPAMQPVVVPVAAVQYAGFWRRVAAYIIDSIVIGIVAQLLITIVGFGIDSFAAIQAIYGAINLVGGWLYYAIMQSSSNQATLGKMALAIIVTDSAGNKISFARATGRHFAKIISTIILLIGFFMIAFTKKKQGLHDMLADTLVIQKKQR